MARTRWSGWDSSAAKRLGLPLEEIAELLGVWERGACAQVKDDLRPRLRARLAAAQARRAEVEAFIAEMRRALARLDALPDRAERCDSRCGFPAEGNAAGGGAAQLPWPVRAEPGAEPEPEAGPEADSAADGEAGHERWSGAPIACSLRPGELHERAERWRGIFAGGRRQETDQGVEVSVPAERAGELARLCVAEQECCPFFGFALRFDGPVVRLEVRAPQEARELIGWLTA